MLFEHSQSRGRWKYSLYRPSIVKGSRQFHRKRIKTREGNCVTSWQKTADIREARSSNWPSRDDKVSQVDKSIKNGSPFPVYHSSIEAWLVYSVSTTLLNFSIVSSAASYPWSLSPSSYTIRHPAP